MKRRTFVIGSAAVAGGLLIGYQLQRPLEIANPLLKELGPEQSAITPYVIIDKSGITLVAPRAEMGQGIHGTLAALVAEELDVLVADVRVIPGPPSQAYSNDVAYPPAADTMTRRVKLNLGMGPNQQKRAQLTGGQTSIRDAFVKMRKAGAAARTVILQTVEKQFGVPINKLTTDKGMVILPDGTAVPYSELAVEAAKLTPPADPPLKPRREWKQLGKSQPRVDMVGKCTGTAEYAIDVQLPNMLHAVVKLNPNIGGGLVSYDETNASTMRGFKKIIPIDDGLIIVATNTWYAWKAAAEVEVEWGSPPYPASTAEHRHAVESALDGESFKHWKDEGDVESEFSKPDAHVVQANYYVPYLAHATMEPMCAVAWLRDGELEIWAGNQNPMNTQHVGSQIAGIPIEAVKVHSTYMGGGFGRRLEMDFVKTAVHAACSMPGTPLKVTWPREEDMTHDAYRPTAAARFRGKVSEGNLLALDLSLASPGLFESAADRGSRSRKSRQNKAPSFDKFSATGAKDQPYRIDNYRISTYSVPRLLPVGWWRGVGESQNTFFHESSIDELAHTANADPLQFRLSMLDHEPSRKVLEKIAKLSNWGDELPQGHAKGIAYALSSDAATAQVIEVSQKNNTIRIEKVFVVVDVGIALDPRNIEAQIVSSLLFGLCAAVHGEITINNGSVQQRTYKDYPILTCGQAPEIELAIHESQSEIFGVGESATPTAAPALGNAIFAATGKRIRALPFCKSIDFSF